MKNSAVLSCALAGFLLFVSCTHKLDEIRIVPQAHEFTMLIAGDASAFKDGVRDKIIQKYGAFCEIHVVNIEDLPRLDAKPYDVVVIMDTCLAWSGFNSSLKSFLDKDANRVKTVLSMTAGNPDWQFQYKGVDAITSASVLTNQERFFSRIDLGIQQVLNQYRL